MKFASDGNNTDVEDVNIKGKEVRLELDSDH